MRAKLSNAADAFTSAPTIPSVWKSMTSGNVWKVKVQQDHLYLELAASDEARKSGEFVLGDLRKQGPAYVGMERLGTPGTPLKVAAPA